MTTEPRIDLTAEPRAWRVVSDGVMGGVSTATLRRDGDALRFAGEISLANNGGFASARRSFEPADYDGAAAGFVVHARGDGNRFRLRVYTRDPATGAEHAFSHFAVFETRAGEATRSALRWPQFEASFRGRAVPNAPPIEFADIVGIGVMITKDDHRRGSGPFALDLLRIDPLPR